MPKARIKVIETVPGPSNLKAILVGFAKGGRGTVTSFSELRLRALHRLASGLELDVEPFGVVVGQILALSGGRSMPLAQAGHVRAAVAEACFALNEDSPFFEASGFPGTHRKVAGVLSELREWGLDSDALTELAGKTQGGLAAKLRSLAEVERDVSECLRSIARERNSDRIASCLELTPDREDLGRLMIVADEAPTFHELKWLEWAVRAGIKVSLVVDRSGERSGLFREVRAAAGRLPAEIKEAGSRNRLLERLFSQPPESGDSLPSPTVQIASCADSLSEAEWALRGILSDLESGLPIDRVAIFCRDAEGYFPLLESASKRLGVPISSSRRVPLMTNSFAKLTLRVLEFCAGKDVRSLSWLFRSSYLVIEQAVREAGLEALRLASAQGEGQWQALADWAKEQEDVGWLRPLLDWRQRNLNESADLATWADRLVEMGHQPWHEEALSEGSRTSVRDSYAQSAFQRSLAQYASVERARSRRRITLPQFARTCRRIWEEAEVTTPSTPDSVQIVSSTMELGETDVLYVLGMLEGVFPRRRSEDPILTDADRAALSALFPERPPLPNSHSRALRERDEFYRLCAVPGQKLILSYPLTDDDRDNVRAFYLVELDRAIPGEIRYADHPRSVLAPEESLASADSALHDALVAPKEAPLPNELVEFGARCFVSEAAKRSISPEELSELLECPFRYLAKGALALRPNRNTSRWFHLFQLPMLTGLASLPAREAAENALSLALESAVEKLHGEASEHDLALIRTGGRRLIEEWIDREYAARELWPRDNTTGEPSFDNGLLRDKLKADGGYVYLSGKLPALSNRDGYRVLHLFEASEPWSEGATNEDDVWSRLKEKERFKYGLLLASLYGTAGEKVGIEVDSASGARNLFLMPRPQNSVRSDRVHGFRVTGIDADRRGRIFADVGENIRKALRHIQQADVRAQPGEHCRTCEYGELCRRSQGFGESVDPFEEVPDGS